SRVFNPSLLTFFFYVTAALRDHISFPTRRSSDLSTEIDYRGNHMPDDGELKTMMDFARELGLKIILKPTVNVRDGSWRAHINFLDRKSTRLNSSHVKISYAVFCLKKKNKDNTNKH